MQLFTIGFTKKTAEQFFETLRGAGVKRVIDVRLHNVSQLAGFTKRDDLQYFLRRICDVDYLHELRLAPDADSLDAVRAKRMSWSEYAVAYERLLETRGVAEVLDRRLFDRAVLLCSEATAKQCHRRLAAEYLARKWAGTAGAAGPSLGRARAELPASSGEMTSSMSLVVEVSHL